jgi:hypothetical protein
MIRAFQFDNFWLAVVLWLLFCLCDYYLTLIGNRLWMKYGQAHIEFEGSYELNPHHQKDVDALRWLSPRYLVMLSLSALCLAFIRWLSDSLKVSEIFTAVIGCLLLTELTVIARHVENISRFTLMKEPGSIEGHIRSARWVDISLLARDYGYWALLFLILFCLTGSWLFVGGTLSGLLMFVRYSRQGARLRREKVAQIVS